MKLLLALFLITPLFAATQDCKIRKAVDPYTKEIKLSTGFIFLKGGSVTVDADSKEIDLLFTIDGMDKCFDNNSVAYLFFDGVKTKFSVRNGGTMNCEGLFHFIYKNSVSTTSLLTKITTQKLSHIIFTGNNKKETIVSFDPATQESMMQSSACLVNEAKLLLK